MKTGLRNLLCAGLVLLGTASAMAQPQPLLLVTANYPPFSYEEGGQQKGIAVELIREAFRRMQQPVTIEFVPFARALEMVKTGDADGVFPFAFSEERKVFASFSSEKLIIDPGSLFVRADSPIVFDGDYAKLAPYTIGMQRGTSHGPAFMQALTTYGIKTDLAENQERNVAKLVAGRFDIAIGPRQVVLHAARLAGKSNDIKLLYSGVTEGYAYLGMTRQRPHAATLQAFDRVLRGMRQDGSYERIARGQ